MPDRSEAFGRPKTSGQAIGQAKAALQTVKIILGAAETMCEVRPGANAGQAVAPFSQEPSATRNKAGK